MVIHNDGSFYRRVGFTGTQRGLTRDQGYAFYCTLKTIIDPAWPSSFHHGDCIGADADSHNIVTECVGTMRVIIHPPIDPKKRAWKNASMIMPEKDYMTRNQDIVNAVEVLIACPGEMTEQLRSGTWSTIRKGIKKGIPVYVIFPNGTLDIR